MTDPRIDRMEKDISAFSGMEDRLIKRMEEMVVAALHMQSPNSNSGEGSSKNKGPKTYESHTESGFVAPKLAKLNFPQYDGSEDPTSWICRAEQFFNFQNTSEDEKLPLAAYHLEGEAQLWYQLFKNSEEEPTWNAMKEGLHARYGPTQFEDFFGDLTKLRQTGTVREYQGQYERLLSRAGGLTITQQIGGFINELCDDIRAEVQASRPNTLTVAVGLARLFEARQNSHRRTTGFSEIRRPTTSVQQLPPLRFANLSRNQSPFIKRLNLAELKERRQRGLCFNCDEKFSPRHRCKKLFLIERVYEEEEIGRLEDGEPNYGEEEDVPEISLHAIAGIPKPQTMRIKGVIQKNRIIMLVDSGSTHNFLSVDVASQLGLHSDKNTGFEVLVAYGEKLISQGKCSNVQVWLNGTPFLLEFYLLSLGGYDSVLGAQWLRTLSPILWDFSKLMMSFQCIGSELTLTGLAAPANQLIEGFAMTKYIKKKKGQGGILLQIFAIELGLEQKHEEVQDPDLQQILHNFQELFEEPHGLPPTHPHDHRILLTKGAGVVQKYT